MRWIVAMALVVSASGIGAGRAEAQAGIRVHELESVRVDGAARDWRGASFAEVGAGADASMRVALGHDAESLYVVAEVRDDRLVRTTRPGAREDAVIVTLAIPAGRGRRAVDVYLFAGVSGRGAASAGLAPIGSARVRPLAAAEVVEGPLSRGAGYTVEARIPFSAIPGAREWQRATASIRLRDVDSEAHPEVEAEPALVEVDPQHLERLVPLRPTGGSAGALERFLSAQGILAARPAHELTGDVIGDAQPERVYVVDRFVLVTGPAVHGGGYAFHQLPITHARDVRSAELRDLTGDGKRELILVVRQTNEAGERDLWQVFSLDDPIRPVFGVEVRKAVRGAGEVEARVRVLPSRGRQAPEIEVRAHRAEDADEARYRERPADDAEAMLLPWGPVRARRYRWSGRAFEQTREEANPRYRPPASETPTRAGTGTASAPPAPPDADALLAAFRRERGIGRGVTARFRMSTNIAGDRAPETAHVYGTQLVIVGPGIQEGRSWMFYEVPVADPDDLLDARAADVTGDQRAEILFRVRQRFGEVARELLLVHQVTDRGFPPILQVEVARTRGDAFVRNEIQTRGGHLEIRPGRARGFSATSWPFTRDPSDTAQPILVPWQDRPVRYRFAGGRLTR